MNQRVDFYYDFLSPYSYLAFSQLPSFARRAGAEVIFKPVEVLKVMARVGNSPTSILCIPKVGMPWPTWPDGPRRTAFR